MQRRRIIKKLKPVTRDKYEQVNLILLNDFKIEKHENFDYRF
mgnify:CR=1 FL=1